MTAVVQHHPADDGKPDGQQIGITRPLDKKPMQGHVVFHSGSHVLLAAGAAQSFHRSFKETHIVFTETVKYTTEREDLDSSPQFHNQWLDPLVG